MSVDVYVVERNEGTKRKKLGIRCLLIGLRRGHNKPSLVWEGTNAGGLLQNSEGVTSQLGRYRPGKPTSRRPLCREGRYLAMSVPVVSTEITETTGKSNSHM